MIARIALLLLPGIAVTAAAQEQTVVGGPGNDYQAAVIQPWDDPDQRMMVFERLDVSASGDLWLTHSNDGGTTWTEPTAIVATAANERHATLVQTDASRFVLLHLSNASGGFRIHRAVSEDGLGFTDTGVIDLGWPTPGEINPQVIREPDGTLRLAYQRLSGAVHIAASSDDGETWDQLRTQISPGNAALPRLAYREDDKRWLLAYQTGGPAVTIWTRTSDDPDNWTDTPVALVADGNNHDPWPVVMPDGQFVILWGRFELDGFQIRASHSRHGATWSAPLAVNDRPGLKNIQPFALPLDGGGQVELYWGAGQVPGDGDYDIVRLPSVVVVDTLFADGFEKAAPSP